MNFGDAITDFDYRADLAYGHAGFKVLDLLTNDFVDFVCFDWFHNLFFVLGALCFVCRKCDLVFSHQRPNHKVQSSFLPSHSLLNLLQLVANRTVVYGRADARHESADQVRIGFKIYPYFLAGQSRKR